MRTSAVMFTGVAVFFAVAAAVYGWTSVEPAGTAALTVAALMAALIAFFLWQSYARLGAGPQDAGDAEVVDAAGPVDFFPPDTAYPLWTAVGTAVLGLGVVFGPWLFLIGVGVLVPAVIGFVLQHNNRRGVSE
ncbi:aa3-type cytochrome oxidase subunit IV [Actinacidiphila sp. ITFR-21]|uniref:aa3-type cytochrome oxidase subunit IV n=1 Tax=Actinacidiphila sp. ITFR-21 TaxID=3075199 RepID=UPI00288BAA39|nr:cytochrome c oxidase subunit 4 [Streptomyces sp. ITFR-21]WNI14286.1 cytochrome c oxidase subunit 4 [Streptomyces sp. ITFR-21]